MSKPVKTAELDSDSSNSGSEGDSDEYDAKSDSDEDALPQKAVGAVTGSLRDMRFRNPSPAGLKGNSSY